MQTGRALGRVASCEAGQFGAAFPKRKSDAGIGGNQNEVAPLDINDNYSQLIAIDYPI